MGEGKPFTFTCQNESRKIAFWQKYKTLKRPPLTMMVTSDLESTVLGRGTLEQAQITGKIFHKHLNKFLSNGEVNIYLNELQCY